MKTELNRATEVGEFIGRTLEGVAYRYDRPSRVTDDAWKTSYLEEMLRGADTKTLSENTSWPLHKMHDKSVNYGAVTFHHSDDEASLMFRAEVAHGDAGDALLEEIAEYLDVSVGALAIKTTERDSKGGRVVQRAEVKLNELSLAATGTGLVKGAEVEVVRAAEDGTPRLLAAKRRLILLG